MRLFSMPLGRGLGCSAVSFPVPGPSDALFLLRGAVSKRVGDPLGFFFFFTRNMNPEKHIFSKAVRMVCGAQAVVHSFGRWIYSKQQFAFSVYYLCPNKKNDGHAGPHEC